MVNSMIQQWTLYKNRPIEVLFSNIHLKHDGTVSTCCNQSKASIFFDYIA